MAAVPPQPPNPRIPIAPQYYAPNYNQTMVYNYLLQARNDISFRGKQLRMSPKLSEGYFRAFEDFFLEELQSGAPIKEVYLDVLNDVLEQMLSR